MTGIALALKATDSTGLPVVCAFKATVDGKDLETKDDMEPLFQIPAGTKTVVLKATPRRPVFWEETFSFSVAADGSMTVDVDFRPRVQLTAVTNPYTRLTIAIVKVSQFRERTKEVLDLLHQPPKTRRVFNMKKKQWEVQLKKKFFNLEKGKWDELPVDEAEVEIHKNNYGTWPPPDWDLHAVPKAKFLDAVSPVKSGALNFAPDPSLALENFESVVLERAGIRMVPRYFAVTWPQAIAPHANAAPLCPTD